MSRRLRGGSGASVVLGGEGCRRPHSETRDLHDSRIETYTGFADHLADKKGATSSFIMVTADKQIELRFSDDHDTMVNPNTRIQKWVQDQHASFDPARDTFNPARDTFATFATDPSSSLVATSSMIPTSQHNSDFSVRNDSTLEKSMAELDAALDASNFLTAFQNYEKKRAERRRRVGKAEGRLKIFEQPDSTREQRFFTPEPTPSRTRPNFNIAPLKKRTVGGSDARLQLDGEVNHAQSPSANTGAAKTKKLPQVGKKRGLLVLQKIFPCKICLRPFTNRTSAHFHARTHLNSHELGQSSSFHGKCVHCQKVFFTRKAFTDHVNAHDGRKNHDCPVCKRKFNTKTILTGHLFIHLSREEQAEVKRGWRHACYFCKKRFKRSSDLTRHLLTHLKEKPFRCDQCGKTFTTENGGLNVHKRVQHTSNPKPFNCGECEQAFTRKVYLVSHKKTVHRKVKDFACPECPKMFGTKSVMVKHLNGVHLKIRHPCASCGLTFTTKSSVWSHAKRVHPPESRAD